MNIIVVGLNHRTAAVDIRERFALSEETTALYQLKTDPFIQEVLTLSTCNRVEVYAVVNETEAGYQTLQKFFLNRTEKGLQETVAGALYCYGASDCVKHLFRVAAGLDSMVLGEPQILGQIKDAFDLALSHKTTGIILNKVFKKAISVAKRVRTETKIAENAMSVAFAAVELARKIFGRLNEKSVMLIGAGEMAELAVRHFSSNGVRSIFIANRSYDRTLQLASEYDATPVEFDNFLVEMTQADIVLCSTGAPHYLIGPNEMAKVMSARQQKPIFLIDISVPRNIDPETNRLDNLFLYDIDDLKLAVEKNIRLREGEALKAEEIVAEETQQWVRWFKSLDAVPMIVALKEKAEEIRQKEISRTLDRLSSMPLSPEQQEAIEGLTQAIVNKLLHGPLTTLKEESCDNNGSLVLEAAQKLFLLGGLKPKENIPQEKEPA